MIEIKTDQYEYPGIEEKLAETLKAEIGLFNMHIAAFIWLLWKKSRYWNQRYSWTY